MSISNKSIGPVCKCTAVDVGTAVLPRAECIGATIRYPAGEGGAWKDFEINEFLLKNGGRNICTRAPCIYSITGNVGEIFSRHLNVK